MTSTFTLPDGTTVTIRPIRSDDDERLVAFHASLSDETVYLRYFRPHGVLAPDEVTRLTHVDYVDRFAFVAELDGRLIAVGRYEALGSNRAEIAFVVADAFHSCGLGSELLRLLAAEARTHGIETLVAQTLVTNFKMLHVFQHSGFPIRHTTDTGVVTVELDIGHGGLGSLPLIAGPDESNMA